MVCGATPPMVCGATPPMVCGATPPMVCGATPPNPCCEVSPVSKAQSHCVDLAGRQSWDQALHLTANAPHQL